MLNLFLEVPHSAVQDDSLGDLWYKEWNSFFVYTVPRTFREERGCPTESEGYPLFWRNALPVWKNFFPSRAISKD